MRLQRARRRLGGARVLAIKLRVHDVNEKFFFIVKFFFKRCAGDSTSTRQFAPVSSLCAERKKENRQPKGGMGGRHAATTQGF